MCLWLKTSQIVFEVRGVIIYFVYLLLEFSIFYYHNTTRNMIAIPDYMSIKILKNSYYRMTYLYQLQMGTEVVCAVVFIGLLTHNDSCGIL